MQVHGNLIAGEWVTGQATLRDVNPSDTEEVVGEYAAASTEDVETAAAAASDAFAAWSRTTAQVRSDILNAAADELFARREELGRLLAREEGKLFAEGVGEVARAAHLMRF